MFISIRTECLYIDEKATSSLNIRHNILLKYALGLGSKCRMLRKFASYLELKKN